MKRIINWGIIALFMAGGAVAQAQEFSELEYYKQLAEKQLAENKAPTPSPVTQTIYYECDDEPANAIVAIPRYFHSRNSATRARIGSDRLNVGKGRANGFGIAAGYARRVTDWFSFKLLYEYDFLAVRGGSVSPDDPPLYATERSRWNTHMIGLAPEFNFGQWGRFSPSVIQAFDRAQGNVRFYTAPNTYTTESLDGEGANTTSLMAWYEKDFDFCNGWSLTPYAGWRSLYSVARSRDADRDGDNDWLHFISGGLKARYQHDNIGFTLRGGVNHRTSRNDYPTFGYRAVAPGVTQFSHRANLDKTVWSFGAGVSYYLGSRTIVAAGYDGYVGKDTSAHVGSVSFIFPF